MIDCDRIVVNVCLVRDYLSGQIHVMHLTASLRSVGLVIKAKWSVVTNCYGQAFHVVLGKEGTYFYYQSDGIV